MKKKWSRYRENIIAFFIIAVLCVGIISVIAIFGGAIMKIFGFEYESVGSIIFFFLIASIISFPISLVVEALPNVLLVEFGKISKRQAIVMYIVLDTITNSVELAIVDYFMQSVSATDSSILVVSFILSLFGVKDIGNKPKGA